MYGDKITQSILNYQFTGFILRQYTCFILLQVIVLYVKEKGLLIFGELKECNLSYVYSTLMLKV